MNDGGLTTTGLVTMILILSFVWGGFGVILITAIRKERDKIRDRT